MTCLKLYYVFMNNQNSGNEERNFAMKEMLKTQMKSGISMLK